MHFATAADMGMVNLGNDAVPVVLNIAGFILYPFLVRISLSPIAGLDGFSIFGILGDSSTSSPSFKKIVNRYLNIINYSGEIEHKHTFSFSGGTKNCNLKTHADALPEDYLKVVGGTSNHNNQSSQLGVEAVPGEVAAITEYIATGSDRGGSYFGYRDYLYSSEVRNRVEVGSYSTSVTFDVTGTSEVYVSITNQDGTASAGWWSIE